MGHIVNRQMRFRGKATSKFFILWMHRKILTAVFKHRQNKASAMAGEWGTFLTPEIVKKFKKEKNQGKLESIKVNKEKIKGNYVKIRKSEG